jgi:hypothetical protein
MVKKPSQYVFREPFFVKPDKNNSKRKLGTDKKYPLYIDGVTPAEKHYSCIKRKKKEQELKQRLETSPIKRTFKKRNQLDDNNGSIWEKNITETDYQRKLKNCLFCKSDASSINFLTTIYLIYLLQNITGYKLRQLKVETF